MQIVKYLLHFDIVLTAIVLVPAIHAQKLKFMPEFMRSNWDFRPIDFQRTYDVQETNCIVGNLRRTYFFFATYFVIAMRNGRTCQIFCMPPTEFYEFP